MWHKDLKRSAKRYCVECDKYQKMRVEERQSYAMHICVICGQEVSRVRDGMPRCLRPRVSDGVDVHAAPVDDRGKASTVLALERADVLNCSHTLWPPRDNSNREELFKQLETALSCLTPRQREVLDAVIACKTVSEAAERLGISQPGVTTTLKKIARKVNKKVII